MDQIKIIEGLFGVKIDNLTRWILNLIILILIILAFWLIPKYSKQQGELLSKKWNQSNFSGIVDSLYCDYSNHAVVSIFFNNGNKQTGLPQEYFYTIKKDDSLYKLKNNDTIYLKRDTEIIKLN